MQAVFQIIKVNLPKSGTKDGRAWEMQDCECIMLDVNYAPDQVGVLMVPKDLRGRLTPGTYTGSFTLRPDLRTRRIEAVLIGLEPFVIPAKKVA